MNDGRLFDPHEEEYRCPNCGMVGTIDDFDVVGTGMTFEDCDDPYPHIMIGTCDDDDRWCCPQCGTWQEMESVK
jgi:rubredoxin